MLNKKEALIRNHSENIDIHQHLANIPIVDDLDRIEQEYHYAVAQANFKALKDINEVTDAKND